MERDASLTEKIAATEQVCSVVDVAAISRAAASADDVQLSEFRQVVRDQVLWLPDQRHKLPNATIASAKLDDDLPSQRIAE